MECLDKIVWIKNRFEIDCQEEMAFQIELRKDFYGNRA